MWIMVVARVVAVWWWWWGRGEEEGDIWCIIWMEEVKVYKLFL